MHSMTKGFFVALIAAATTTLGAPTVAQAGGDTCNLCDCNACDGGDLISSLINIVGNTTKLALLNGVNVEDVYVVKVQDVLSGDFSKTLTFKNLLILKNLDIAVLQTVLSNFKVIDNDGTLINITDVLNDNNVVLTDIVAVNVLDDGKIILFHK